MEKAIIPAADKNALVSDLAICNLLKRTRTGGNEIYLITEPKLTPSIIQEIGRLREYTFRDAGGGTGNEMDIDDFDLGPIPYKQLIVWDPIEKEIVGGYRFLNCREIDPETDTKYLSSSNYFHFSDKFKTDYLPFSIELGRSWIQPKYQCRPGNRKGLFSLDNLWEGIGAVIAADPQIKYLFGKVTIHTHFNAEARNILLGFMKHYFHDTDRLVEPKRPIMYAFASKNTGKLFHGLDYNLGYKKMKSILKELGEHIPPLVNAYMGLSKSMKVFGSTVNTSFGNVIDTGILIKVEDIFAEKRKRYLGDNYLSEENKAA